VRSMFPAKRTVLTELKAVWGGFLVLTACVVASFTLTTGQYDINSHEKDLLS
jgi:hypothetical protein